MPKIADPAAADLTDHSARLIGTVQPGFAATSYHFEYGPTRGYGFSAAAGSLGADNTAHPVAADLAGLAPGTTYHFRIVATNAIGTTAGDDVSFSTPPAPVAVAPPQKPAPKKCKKGKVKRGGKCVPKKKKKRRRRKHG